MSQNDFQKRKEDVLGKLDKSSKKSWDDKILRLCEKINSFEEYYTTSSCAGRVVLMVNQDKKAEDLFRFVSHDLISFDGLKKQVESLDKGTSDDVKFKLDPPIIHIACEGLEDAQRLYDKAKIVGWKRSGLVAFGKRFILELNSTEKLEFPVFADGKILGNDEFLRKVIEISNRKLEKGWEKIEKLEKSLN
jgi:tRNA wybutosine-synthesizing protein 3